MTEKALGEVRLFHDSTDKFEDQPMHEHVLKADHALGAIVTTSPCGSATGAKFYRRLRADEAEWSSVLRELTGYRDAFLTLSRSVTSRAESPRLSATPSAASAHGITGVAR